MPQINSISEMPELKRLKLLPFGSLNACPKCGEKRSSLPMWLQRFLGLESTAFKLSYCIGNRDPQMNLQTPFGNQEFTVACAGITHDHLHHICMMCGALTLTEVKPED